MAVVNLKSGPITNRDTSPLVKNNDSVEGGMLRESVGYVETSAADTSSSTYRFCQVPSNARLSEVRLYSDDLGTAGVADFGLYRTVPDGGSVVDADFIASAVNLNAAALNGTDITHESTVYDIDDGEKMIWQALGLTSDPRIMYDVVGTVTTATEVAGSILLKVRYVQ